MIRNTVITEQYHTSGGQVDVVIEVNVKGEPDAVASVDRQLVGHVKDRSGAAVKPLFQQVNGQTIPGDQETIHAFEAAIRKPG